MNQGIRLDEAQSVWQTSRDLGGVLTVIAKDVHVPLYFVGLHFWEVIFGTEVFTIRFFSLIFFLISIPTIFYLAREAYSSRVAYSTALISAVSPFLNWYGSEARMYSMLYLFTVLSHFLFIKLWKRPSIYTWIAFAIVTVLGLFTHLFFSFIIIDQISFYIFHRGLFESSSGSRFSLIAFISGTAGAAWFVFRFIAGAGLSNPLLTRPTTFDFFNVFSNFFLGFQTDIVNTYTLSLWPVLVFIAFTFISRKREYEPQTAYFLLSSFVPIALAFGVSVLLHPLFLSRYLIICLPSIYILAVYFLSTYKGYIGDIAISALAASMVLMLVIQAIQPLSPVKEDYRSAVAFVNSQINADDIFVVSAPFITYPVEYYYKGPARLTTFPQWNRFAVEELVPEPYSPELMDKRVGEWAAVYRDMYLLLGYDQGYEEELRLYMDKRYQRLEMKTFSPGLTLYVYKLRYI
jgi:mannosyltransferase